MRTAVLAAPRRVELREVEVPEPEETQVRIRIEGCGICASSLPLFEGREWYDYPRNPGEPGHEGWGTVDAVGARVDDIAVGDRVGVLSYRAFAEYDLADAAGVVALPRELGRLPLPVEPLACAMNVFRRSGVHAGSTVAVVGVGFLGALLVQLSCAAGARVIALSRRRIALAIAERCGAAHLLSLDDPATALAAVEHLTTGQGCNRVFECVGRQESLDIASEMVAVRGRLVIAGYHQDGMRQVNLQRWNWRGIDVINAHERDPTESIRGAREAVAAVRDGRLDPVPLLTHAFPLAELGLALEAARVRPDGFMKAWIEV